MHISGSRVMDKCIIGMYIMVTCIRIKNIRIAHAYIHQVQESYMHACFRIKVQYHRYMHLHTCIRVKVQYHQTPRIALSVRSSVTKFQPHHRYMHHTYMYQDQGLMIISTCIIHTRIIHRGSSIKDHKYMNHTYMHHIDMYQDQGLRIKDQVS